MNNYKNSKVLIMGLGTKGGGVESALYFAKKGANVTVTDLQNRTILKNSLKSLKKYNISYVLGRHREEDFINNDYVIKNPDVKPSSHYLRIAKQNNVDIQTDLSLFFRFFKGKIIGVTGTKGKSTTTALVTEILKVKYPRCFIAGNICKSPLAYLDRMNKDDLVVLELSSWQLRDLREYNRAPHLGIFLNFSEDHMNYYANMKDYLHDKEGICAHQNTGDMFICNWDNPFTRQVGLSNKISRTYYFSLHKSVKNGCSLKNGDIIFTSGNKSKAIARLKDVSFDLITKKHLENVLSSVLAAHLLKLNKKQISTGLNNFHGLWNRLEKVTEIRDRLFVNDSSSTVPESTINTISSFNKPIILISGGGGHKNLSQEKLCKVILKKVKTLILFDDKNTSEKIYNYLKIMDYSKKGLKVIFVSNMKKAVTLSYKFSSSGDAIILSSACSGAPYFEDSFDRGILFKKEAALLSKKYE